MTINTTTLEANLTTKINNTSGTTDGKEFLLLGKAVEAVNTAISNNSLGTANNLSDVANAATARTNLGLGTMAVETATDYLTTANATSTYLTTANATSTYAPLAGATFTGAVSGTDLTLSGDLTVNGTQTVLNTATLTVDDINITIADGAANSAAADGAGITIDGAGVNFQYSDSGKHMSLNTGLAVDEVKEKVLTQTSTTGAIDFDAATSSIRYFTSAQTANRSINFRGINSITLDSIMSVGQSMTFAVLMTQGSTAYYLNSYTIDGTAVTPKWQGGSAPTAGNASGIDAYSFTVIKTAASTFTVLASQTQFA